MMHSGQELQKFKPKTVQYTIQATVQLKIPILKTLELIMKSYGQISTQFCAAVQLQIMEH